MLTLPFTKYAGAGNDFIVIDAIRHPALLDETKLVRLVRESCDRIRGVGSDGLILLSPSDEAPFEMRFFNPDGSFGALCGNGARCAVQAARDAGIVSGSRTEFAVLGAINRAEFLRPEYVRVFVQRPKDIKLNFSLRMGRKIFIDASYVDVGSQHSVVSMDQINRLDPNARLDDFKIEFFGPMLRWHIDFAPVGANANFFEVREDVEGKYLRIRTWERGVEGETLACGTGCISTAIIAHATKRIDNTSIRLLTQSGEFVTVAFEMIDGRAEDLSLEGSAIKGRSGVIEVDEASGTIRFS